MAQRKGFIYSSEKPYDASRTLCDDFRQVDLMHFSIDKSAIFLMALFLVIILLISLFAPKIESHQAVREGVVDMMGRTVVLDGSVKKAMLFTPMPWHYLTVDETDKNTELTHRNRSLSHK